MYSTFYKKAVVVLALFICPLSLFASATSVAGLFPIANSGRVVYNFNEGWHFLLGDAAGAEAVDFDDAAWEMVCAPHTVRLEPSEVSGCRNYQGVCWYRKKFVVPADMQGKEITVHFEAVMGKQQVYVNGRLVKEHLGGYLPITIDLSKEGVKAGDKCLIAVRADNSDDKNYPPGKKQTQLDFAYHGGMYRDVWLIGKSLRRLFNWEFHHYVEVRLLDGATKVEAVRSFARMYNLGIDCEDALLKNLQRYENSIRIFLNSPDPERAATE